MSTESFICDFESDVSVIMTGTNKRKIVHVKFYKIEHDTYILKVIIDTNMLSIIPNTARDGKVTYALVMYNDYVPVIDLSHEVRDDKHTNVLDIHKVTKLSHFITDLREIIYKNNIGDEHNNPIMLFMHNNACELIINYGNMKYSMKLFGEI